MKPIKSESLAIGLAMCFVSCGSSLPAEYETSDSLPIVYPDYIGIDIPVNIAPLNFDIMNEGEDFITHLYSLKDSEGFIIHGKRTDIAVEDWRELMNTARGDTLMTDVYVGNKGRYTKFATIKNPVRDSIDNYISYRLIEPSYISFETMAICQRDLTTFDESEIYNSQSLSEENQGQCVNCHSYQGYNRDGNMQMHVRVGNGGTVICHESDLKKVDLKTPYTISAGVYPSWHPSESLIAYSVNTTSQNFHTRDINKVEVQDSKSDLILYDVVNEVVSPIAMDSTELETFPYWHPDGRSLWYVSAKVPNLDEKEMLEYQNMNYERFKYDIYRREFDTASRSFGRADTIFKASEFDKSATLPRPSPDGKYLMFTLGKFGTFHIWHHDSDLYLMEIATREVRPLTEINSPDTESYHSWSSNGKWVIFSSRRDDGSYTRLYIAHFKPDGTFGKPFILPQPTPDFESRRMKSYNIPEFMVKPVSLTKRELINTIKRNPVKVTFRQ
jgi:hypothetical protein